MDYGYIMADHQNLSGPTGPSSDYKIELKNTYTCYPFALAHKRNMVPRRYKFLIDTKYRENCEKCRRVGQPDQYYQKYMSGLPLMDNTVTTSSRGNRHCWNKYVEELIAVHEETSESE